MSKGYCPYCGREVEGDFVYCPECGKLLPSFQTIERETAPPFTLGRMEITENIVSSLNYAALLFKDLGTLILLAILWPIPLVNLIVSGFIYNVIRESPESEILPSLRGFGGLWIRGLKLTLVSLLYMLIPTLILTLSGVTLLRGGMRLSLEKRGSMVSERMAEDILEYLSNNFLLFLPMLLVTLLLLLSISVILWMALVHSVKTDSLLSAFSLGKILSIISRVGWGRYFVWLFVIFVLGTILGSILFLLIFQPIFYVFVARSAAQIYSEGRITDISNPSLED